MSRRTVGRPGVGRRRGRLAGELARTVGVDRVRAIIRAIAQAVGPTTVEHLVGRDENEIGSRARRRLGQPGDGLGIAPLGDFGLPGTAVDVGPGRGVDDHLGLVAGDQARCRADVIEVIVGPAPGQRAADPGEWSVGQGGEDGPAQTATRAGDRDPHVSPPAGRPGPGGLESRGFGAGQSTAVLAFVVGVPVAGLDRAPPAFIGPEPVDGQAQAVGEGNPVAPAEGSQLRAVEGVTPVVAGAILDRPDERPGLAEASRSSRTTSRLVSSAAPGMLYVSPAHAADPGFRSPRRGRSRTASRAAAGHRRRAAAAGRRGHW